MKKTFIKRAFLTMAAAFMLAPLTATAQDISLSASDPSFSGPLNRGQVYEFQIATEGKVYIKGEGTYSFNSGIPQYILYNSNNAVYENGVAASSTDFDFADGDNPAYADWTFDAGVLQANTTYYLAFNNVAAPASANFTITFEASGEGGNDVTEIILSDSNPSFSGTLNQGQVYEFRIENEGKVYIKGEGTYSFNTGVPQYILYNSNNTVYDNGIGASSSDFEYADDNNPAYVEWTFDEGVLQVNTTYYLAYNNTAAPASATFTITLGDDSTGGGDVTPTPEDVTMESGVPTPLEKGQKGIVTYPSDIAYGRSTQIKIVADTDVQIGKYIESSDFYTILFENDTWYTPQKPVSVNVENGLTTWIFEPVYYGEPFAIQQEVLDQVTFTVTFPAYDEMQTVEFDDPFVGSANTMYQFEVAEPMTIQVSSTVPLTERQWNRIIYKDKSRSTVVTTNTKFADSTGSADAETNSAVTFRLTSAGTYYFYVENAATYEITQYEDASTEKKPAFETAGVVVFPIEGVESISMFQIQYPNQILDDDSINPDGIVITNPDGVKLGINKVFVDAADGSSTYDRLAITIANADANYAKVQGTYKIYIPEATVYNTENAPNPLTELEYVLKPTSSGPLPYFEWDDVTINVPGQYDGYMLSNLGDFIITFPWEIEYYIQPTDSDEEGTNPTTPTSVTVLVNQNPVDAEINDDYELWIPVSMVASTANVNVSVTIPNSLVKAEIDGQEYVNSAYTYNFTLVAPTAEATLTPEEGTIFYANTEDKSVVVSWNGSVVFNNADSSFEKSGIALLDEDEDEVALEYDENVYLNDDFGGLTFDFAELEEGSYTISIPQAAILVLETEDEADSMDPQYTYSLNKSVTAVFFVSDQEDDSTAITIVGADENGNFTVYNLNGVKVAEGKANVVRSLNPGIYVINGKKVAVK